MATLSRGQTFGSTETVTNTKLHNLVDLGSVTNIVDADCSPSMNLADTKLADITTGNKVRGSALGNLASIPAGAGVIPFVNLPVLGSTMVSLTSIPNQSLQPLTRASWVDGATMRNIQSMPSLAGQLAWYSIVSSLASGSSVIFNGTDKFIGGNSTPSYSSGSYFIGGLLKFVSAGSTGTYTKVLEMYVPRSGTLSITYGVKANDLSFDHFSRIYRNGVAVGTERNPYPSTTYTEYSENISGWSVGDLLQIYARDTGSAFTVGGIRLYESTPVREVYNPSTYPTATIWTGVGVPDNGIGSQGDLFMRLDGGASTTLYVKTGASTWTAK